MPTYDYECKSCGRRFAVQQAMSDKPLGKCPECGGAVERIISGGGGFIMKGSGGTKRAAGGCSLETTGHTCCGRDQRCGKGSCDH